VILEARSASRPQQILSGWRPVMMIQPDICALASTAATFLEQGMVDVDGIAMDIEIANRALPKLA